MPTDIDVSLQTDIPEDLHKRVLEFLTSNPPWSQDDFVTCALAMFLMQVGDSTTSASHLLPTTKEKIKLLLPECKEWEAAPDLEPLTLSITLTGRESLAIAQVKSVSKHIIPQVREALNFTPSDNFDDIPF